MGLDLTYMIEAKSRHTDYLRAAEAYRMAKRAQSTEGKGESPEPDVVITVPALVPMAKELS